jgi:hypothetical protein
LFSRGDDDSDSDEVFVSVGLPSFAFLKPDPSPIDEACDVALLNAIAARALYDNPPHGQTGVRLDLVITDVFVNGCAAGIFSVPKKDNFKSTIDKTLKRHEKYMQSRGTHNNNASSTNAATEALSTRDKLVKSIMDVWD